MSTVTLTYCEPDRYRRVVTSRKTGYLQLRYAPHDPKRQHPKPDTSGRDK